MNDAIELANDRPRVGLIVLACIQFFFGAISFFFLVVSLLLALGTDSNLQVYSILSPLLTGVAMFATGAGYLRRSWVLGFVGGNLLAVATLANILVFNLLEGFVNLPFHLPSLVYPIVLLALLNLRYRKAFKSRRKVHSNTA